MMSKQIMALYNLTVFWHYHDAADSALYCQLLFSRFFVSLLFSILLPYITKSHVSWCCKKHREKVYLLLNWGLNSFQLSYKKKEIAIPDYLSGHVKYKYTLQVGSLFLLLTYTTQVMRP